MPSSAMFSESLSARKSSSAEARAAERRVLQAHAEAEDERWTIRAVSCFIGHHPLWYNSLKQAEGIEHGKEL